jgi:hypothetical protein
MSEQAGGVALVATLDYGPALDALDKFKAAIQSIENSGASIGKMAEALQRTGNQLQEVGAGLNANAQEAEVAIAKINEMAVARKAAAEVAVEASAEEAAAGKIVTDQMKETAAQYVQAQKAQSAAAKVRAAEAANATKSQAEAEARAAADRVANFQTAQALEKELAASAEARAAASSRISDSSIVSQRAEQEAAQLAAAKELEAQEKAAAADRVANYKTALALEEELAASEARRVAASAKISDSSIVSQREEQEKAAARAAADRIANDQTALALEKELMASEAQRAAASSKIGDSQVLAQRTEQERDAARAAADRIANDQIALALEKELAASEAQRTAASAKISDSTVLAQRAEQVEALKREMAAQKELQAIEASRNADLVASAAYLSKRDGARLRTLQEIAAAEKLSGTTAANNPSLAAKFPSAAIGDYTVVGAAQKTAHQLAADLEAVGEAGGKAAIGFHATAGTAREFTTIMKDLFTGEWSRMAASVTRLLTISGTFDGILSVLGLSLFAAGTATAVMAAAAIKGAQEQNALNLALAQTNNIAGTTVSGLEEIAESAAHAGGTIGSAKDVVLELAQSGRYTADQIAAIATSAALLQQAGGNVENFVKQVQSIKDSPTEAVFKLDEQYHFLTASTYEAIAAAERHGDRIGAVALAMSDLTSATDEASKKVIEDQGLMIAGWMEVKKLISETIDALEGLGRKQSIGQQIAKLQADIASDKAQGPTQDGAGGVEMNDTSEKEKQLYFLQEQLKYEEFIAKQKGEQTQATRAQVTAQQLLDAERKKLATPADKRAAEEQRLRQGLQPLVDLGVANGGISQQDVDDLVAKANAKYHDKKTPRGHIDPTNYNAAQEIAKQDAAALKTAQDRLAILKNLGIAIDEQKYAQIETLQVTAEQSSYEASRQKILKEIQNAQRNGNADSKASLEASLRGLERQHQAKLQQIQLDYEEQEVQRAIAERLTNINTIIAARGTILKDLNTLYGTANAFDQNALDDAAERAVTQKAQYDQAVQYQQLVQSGADQETLALARQANVLSLATQIYAIEQDRQKLLMDNATTLANIYQQTLNAVDAQIASLEKGRTTLADQVVSGFSSGTQKANESLFQSLKSPQAASKYTLRDYTSNIGGGLYDSITSQLSKSMTETQLKAFQDLLKATGATSQADAARDQAQKDLALNTQSMTDALNVTIPDLLRQLIGLANGTITPSGPVGNAALPGSSNLGSEALGASSTSTPDDLISGYKGSGRDSITAQLDAANDSLKSFKATGTETFSALGMNATQFTGLFYTGVVAATSGGKDAFKNFAAYAIEQLLAVYAIQKLVGLAVSAFGGAAGSENAGAAATSTPDDLISGYSGHADGTSFIDSKGYVTAPGGSRDDTALVRLSHGEAVLNADAVKRLGRNRIDAANKGASRFADGGVVGGSPYASGSGNGGTSVSIAVDARSQGGQQSSMNKSAQDGSLQKELESAVLGIIAKHSTPGGQVYNTVKTLTR